MNSTALGTAPILVILGAFTLCIIVAIRKRWIWPFVVLGGMLLVGMLLFAAFFGLKPSIEVTPAEIVNVTNVPLAREGDRLAEAVAVPLPSRERDWAATAERAGSHATTSWDSIDTKQFRTNIFPSAASAAKDLAKQVPTLLEEMYANSDDLPEFKIQATISARKADDEFREELLKRFPKTTFGTFKKPNNDKKNEVDTAASKTDDSKIVHIKYLSTGRGSTISAWDPPRHTDTGTLSCTITTDQGSRSIRTDYIEKPWVEQQDQFFNAQPFREFAVGSSPTLCESPEAARRSAIQSLQHISLSAPFNGHTIDISIGESLIIDRFLQKLKRPYGNVWREAILVDLNGRKAESIIARTIDQLRSQSHNQRMARSSNWFHIFMLIAVFAATAVAGTVLNWITEGYFRGKIAVTVIVFVIVSLVLTRLMYTSLSPVAVRHGSVSVRQVSPNHTEHGDIPAAPERLTPRPPITSP